MYTVTNYKTKKALKAAVLAGTEVKVFQPGPFGPQDEFTGVCSLEGPHQPEPHKWYARAQCKNGVIVSVK
jgi:hypothetical protein